MKARYLYINVTREQPKKKTLTVTVQITKGESFFEKPQYKPLDDSTDTCSRNDLKATVERSRDK